MHDISVFIANAQNPLIDLADISSEARGLKFGLNLNLHLHFVHASRMALTR